MATEIAPSILAADFTRLGEQLAAVTAAGADLIHIDVMDGTFAPNITLGPAIVSACTRATTLPLDVHLMIEQPDRYLDVFAEAGAGGLTVHAEVTPHLHRMLQQIKALGLKVGLAVNPLTPLEIYREALPYLDLALIMAVNPGFGGQRFIPASLQRIATLRAWRDALNPACRIEVDGGINVDTVAAVVEAGADIVVAGTAVFGSGAVSDALVTLRAAAGR